VQSQTEQKVSQWPSHTVVTQGSSVKLTCAQSGSDNVIYPEAEPQTGDHFVDVNTMKLLTLLLCYQLADVQSQTEQKVSQWPSQTVVTQGSSVELTCAQSGSDQNMYWYRQQSSTELQM
ncbi:hypothetical protein JZ751_014494, partial [Albula glossodonta]